MSSTKCGDRIYLVKGWCDTYARTRLPCGPNPVEMLVFIIVVMKAHREAKFLIAGRSGQTKNAVRYSI